MEKLVSLIRELENKIPKLAVTKDNISTSSVGWHIEHALLTLNLIIATVEKSNPKDYKPGFNFARLLVFTFNKIPRGRAQSPKSVRPKEPCTIQALKEHIDLSIENLKKIYHFNNNSYFEHPFFGHLNVRRTRKFLEIHTRHHLGIINDIVKA